MKGYLVKRILLIIPTLLLVSMVTFLLSSLVSQDPVISLLQSRGAISSMDEGVSNHQQYARVYKELHLEKPNFYFSIVPSHYPENINSIIDPNERAKARSGLQDQKLFFPKVYWHGLDNRYHRWISALLGGSFGVSQSNGQTVARVVSRALSWTLVLTLIDILISFVLGIYIGYYLSIDPNGKIQRVLNQILYLLYSIPKFWLATLLVVYMTTNDYGSWTNIFPSVGMDVLPGASSWAQVRYNLPKLILPIICLSIFSISYISRILRRSILNEMEAPYILTAYSKGLSREQVVRRHALPNAMLPLITILSGSVAGTLAGSVVIEVIFNIPGIGRLMYDSILIADWSVVYCIVLLLALVVSVAYLIGDLCYAYFNPQIRLGQ